MGDHREGVAARGARGPLFLLACALLAAGLTACAGSGGSRTAPATPAGPVSVMPQRDWSDAVLYFVVLDRFADGDATNNAKVDRANPGGFQRKPTGLR